MDCVGQLDSERLGARVTCPEVLDGSRGYMIAVCCMK